MTPLSNETENIRIPDHELIQCIGRGSYGQVWLARNRLGILRAVKVIFRASFDHERPYLRELEGIERFEPVSRSHEGFIDILHVGEDREDRYFYYVMEAGDNASEKGGDYVPKTLSHEMGRGRRLPIPECARIGSGLSSALFYLHEKGLVHRDIKPSNIIFAGGIPKLADIGLVAQIDAQQSIVGTIGYIPPEGPGTPQADIFSLGKVLYEMGTGRDRQDFPALPEDFDARSDVDRLLELNEVVVRACQIDPRRRYPSAREMEADLGLIQTGGSVRRLRFLERRWRTAKRLFAGVAVAFLGLTTVSYIAYEQFRLRSELKERKAGALVSSGIEKMERGDFIGALGPLVEALRVSPGGRQAEEVQRFRIGAILQRAPRLAGIWFSPGQVNALQFFGEESLLMAGRESRAEIINLRTGTNEIGSFGQEGLFETAAASPDGKHFVTTTQGGGTFLWAMGAKGVSRIHELDSPVSRTFAVDFSPAGGMLITGGGEGQCNIRDANTGELRDRIQAHTSKVFECRFSHSGQSVLTASADGSVKSWDVQTKKDTTLLNGRGWMFSVDFSPDDRLIAAGSFDKFCYVVESGTGRLLFPPIKHPAGVRCVRFSPDGRFIATACLDGAIRLWRVATGQPAEENPILIQSSPVRTLAFSEDGALLATGDFGGITRIWDLTATTPPKSVLANILSRATTNCVLLRDGKAAVEMAQTATETRLERVEVESRVRMVTVIPRGRDWSIRLNDDGKLVALTRDNRCEIYDVRTGRTERYETSARIDRVFPDQKALAVVSGDQLIIWLRGNPTPLLQRRIEPVISDVRFDPSGSLLLCAFRDDQVRSRNVELIEVATGKTRFSLRHPDGIITGAFSSDGRYVATACEDYSVRVWEVGSGRQVGSSLHHLDPVFHLSWAPASHLLLTISDDDCLTVWDGLSGERVVPAIRVKAIRSAIFGAGTSLVMDARGPEGYRFYRWDIPLEVKSSEVLAHKVDLLSSFQNPMTNQKSTLPRLSEEAGISSANIFSPEWEARRREWHQWSAGESRAEGAFTAATFHERAARSVRP